MTHLPQDDELTLLMQENFPLQRDYSVYFKSLNADAKKILDYGCSWGYNVFKLNQSGYDAIGFEISVPRAEFGEKKLGVSIFSQAERIRTDNDIVLSSHVIEHLADIARFIKFSKNHLKRNGFFIAFCPNGSPEYRKREPDTFHINWGSLHPNYLDIDFASFMFRENPFYISTGDWEFDVEEIRSWNQTDQLTGSKRDGKELIIISKPNTTIRL